MGGLMTFDRERFDSAGVDIALAHVKVKEADDALTRATERAIVVDRDELEGWHRAAKAADEAFGGDDLASLVAAIGSFLAS
jgi:hypothetical protein